jgi:hypothetical protein
LIISNRVEFKIDRALFFTWPAIVFLILLLVLLFGQMGEKSKPAIASPLFLAFGKTFGDEVRGDEKLECAALELKMNKNTKAMPELDREIVILGRNSRPDAQIVESNMMLGLRRSKQKKVLSNGEKVNLYYDEAEAGANPILKFSDKESMLSVRALILDSESVLLEAQVHLPAEAGREAVDERGQFVLKGQDKAVDPLAIKENDPDFVKAFKQGKFWGRDLFLHVYGGRGGSKEFKLELPGSNDCFWFLDKQALLLWENQEWHLVSSQEVTRGQPLAQIRAADENLIEAFVWDATGFNVWRLRIPKGQGQDFSCRIEDLLTSARIRTHTQVSCRMGKSRMTMKEGDWLLKTELGWKNLKKIEEIDQYLNHGISGELFVFEAIDKRQGQSILRGIHFNQMRTEAREVAIAIAGEKKK